MAELIFQAIADHVDALPRRPDAVVVLTDGYAGRPNIRTPGDWLWLLTDDGTDAAIDGLGRIIRVRLQEEVSRGSHGL